MGGVEGRWLLVAGVSSLVGDEDLDAAEGRTYFVVESRHPDGVRWVEVRRCRSKQEAEQAPSKLIESHGTRDDHRVHKLRIGEPDTQ
jgi:hypothetical protein